MAAGSAPRAAPHGDDHEGIDASEIIGIAGVGGRPVRDGGGGDQGVVGPGAGLAARRAELRCLPAEGTRVGCIERNRIEVGLDLLEHALPRDPVRVAPGHQRTTEGSARVIAETNHRHGNPDASVIPPRLTTTLVSSSPLSSSLTTTDSAPRPGRHTDHRGRAQGSSPNDRAPPTPALQPQRPDPAQQPACQAGSPSPAYHAAPSREHPRRGCEGPRRSPQSPQSQCLTSDTRIPRAPDGRN